MGLSVPSDDERHFYSEREGGREGREGGREGERGRREGGREGEKCY